MKRLPRLHVPAAETDSRVALSRGQNHHLRRVLRLSEHAPLRVFDGDGLEFNATLDIGGKTAKVRIGECVREENEPALAITLVIAISRASRMEWALEKAVELGAADIHPVLTERSKVRLDAARAERRRAHWRGVLVSAAAQCGRARLPRLTTPAELTDTLQAIQLGSRLALLPDADRPLATLPTPGNAIALLIGPESGFSPRETGAIAAAGWQAVRLGPRTLRAETTVPAALAAVQALWGDWRA